MKFTMLSRRCLVGSEGVHRQLVAGAWEGEAEGKKTHASLTPINHDMLASRALSKDIR